MIVIYTWVLLQCMLILLSMQFIKEVYCYKKLLKFFIEGLIKWDITLIQPNNIQ